jgi:predicted Zn-dependent protease
VRRLGLLACAALLLGGGVSCRVLGLGGRPPGPVGAAADSADKAKDKGDKVKSGVDTAGKVIAYIDDLGSELSDENEYWLGRSVATNLLDQWDYDYRDKDAFRAQRLEGVTAYVNKVGLAVAIAAMQNRKDGDRPSPWNGWHFIVLDSEDINAFAAPGGFVLVTVGAIRAATSEDDLACVLAHEIAHIVRGHAVKAIEKSRWADVSKDVIQTTGVLDAAQLEQATGLLEACIDSMINNYKAGFSVESEEEADKRGLEIAQKAGYDPAGMVRFLGTLKAKGKGGAGGSGFNTYPGVDERLKKLGKVKAGPAAPAKRKERFLAALALLG